MRRNCLLHVMRRTSSVIGACQPIVRDVSSFNCASTPVSVRSRYRSRPRSAVTGRISGLPRRAEGRTEGALGCRLSANESCARSISSCCTRGGCCPRKRWKQAKLQYLPTVLRIDELAHKASNTSFHVEKLGYRGTKAEAGGICRRYGRNSCGRL